jgi:hypothetical protein
MKRDQQSAEMVIQLDYFTDTANITVSEWPARYERCLKLYGLPNRTSEKGGYLTSAHWSVPLRCISLRKLAKRVAKAA